MATPRAGAVVAAEDLFEANPEAIVVLDRDDRVVTLNRAFTALFGYTPDDAVGRGLAGLIVPDEDVDASYEINQRAVEGDRVSAETVRCHRDGSRIDVQLTAVPFVRDGQHYIYVIYVDIRDRVAAETARDQLMAELRTERARLNAILEQMPLGVLVCEAPTGRIVLANDRVGELLKGVPPPAHDVTGYDQVDAWHPDGTRRALADRPLVRSLRHGETVQGEVLEYGTFDQSRVVVRVSSAPVRDHHGSITGAVAILDDVTEQRRLESAYRTLVDGSLQGLAIMQDERLVFANETFARYVGCATPAEATALSAAELRDMIHPEDRAASRRRMRERTAGRSAQDRYEIRVRPRGGRPAHLEVWTTVINHDGRPAWQIAAIDITKRVELERELAGARRFETLGQLASGVAHEINTPAQYVSDNLTFVRESWTAVASMLATVHALEPKLRETSGGDELADWLQGVQDEVDVDFLVQEIPRALDVAWDGARRMSQIVAAVKRLADMRWGDVGTLDLNAAIETLLMTSRHEWEETSEILLNLGNGLEPLRCHPAELCQAMLAILLASVERTEDVGRDRRTDKRSVVVSSFEFDTAVCMLVGRSGHTVDVGPDVHVFGPTSARRDVQRLLGAELARAHDIICRLHGGELTCRLDAGVVVAMRVRLPRRDALEGVA